MWTGCVKDERLVFGRGLEVQTGVACGGGAVAPALAWLVPRLSCGCAQLLGVCLSEAPTGPRCGGQSRSWVLLWLTDSRTQSDGAP